MKKYNVEIDSINSIITKFNTYISTSYHIPNFDLSTAFEEKNIVKVVHQDWTFPWPNNNTCGVYFIFGYDQEQHNKNGLYIGKASFGEATSKRLYHHLNPSRTDEYFTKDGYIIDYIASIDMDKLNTPFMAPALEEFLITELREPLNLFNSIGNK